MTDAQLIAATKVEVTFLLPGYGNTVQAYDLRIVNDMICWKMNLIYGHPALSIKETAWLEFESESLREAYLLMVSRVSRAAQTEAVTMWANQLRGRGSLDADGGLE